MAIPHSSIFRVALRLPKSEATWQLVGGVADGAGQDGGPLGAVVVAEKQSGHPRAQRVCEGEVADSLLLGALHSAMVEPPAPLRPERPAILEVEDEDLARLLRKPLRLLGVRVEVSDTLGAAEAAWQRLVDADGGAELLPPGAEVTLAPDVPAWLPTRLPDDAAADARALATGPAPWLVVWAPEALVEASREAIAGVVAVELWPAAPELEPEEGSEAEREAESAAEAPGVFRMERRTAWAPEPLVDLDDEDDEDDDEADARDEDDGPLFADEPPALVAIDAHNRHSALCWDAAPEVRDAFATAARAAGNQALIVLAERHPSREPPAFTALRDVRVVSVLIIADLPMPAEA